MKNEVYKNLSVSIIIPAYNEAERIRTVLDLLKKLPASWEKIIVSDGSTDKTAEIARGYQVKVIDYKENKGKAEAMYRGFLSSTAEIVMFLDADLLRLKTSDIYNLLDPIAKGKADLSIATLHSKRKEDRAVTWSHRLFPFISGQRAANREKWQLLFKFANPVIGELRFGIENFIKVYCKDLGWRFQFVVWEDVSQYTKEKKFGWLAGFRFRLRMYKEILNTKRLINICYTKEKSRF